MEDEFQEEREEMVLDQIFRRGLRNPRLLAAFRRVPRHLFVPPPLWPHAYFDGPLPIGNDQTISQPYIVALMTSLLDLQGDESVLEIGTGSGYQAAILAEMAAEVTTVERFPDLADKARQKLRELGYHNIHVQTGDGTLGWPENAPYAGTLVTAAAPSPPQPLIDQLADGGRLVIPVGQRSGQELQVWTRQGNKFDYENIIPVSFVPLRGKHGWKENYWQ